MIEGRSVSGNARIQQFGSEEKSGRMKGCEAIGASNNMKMAVTFLVFPSDPGGLSMTLPLPHPTTTSRGVSGGKKNIKFYF